MLNFNGLSDVFVFCTCNAGHIPDTRLVFRDIGKFGNPLVLGTRDCEFKSRYPDKASMKCTGYGQLSPWVVHPYMRGVLVKTACSVTYVMRM